MQVIQFAVSDAQYRELARLASQAGLSLEDFLARSLPPLSQEKPLPAKQSQPDLREWVQVMTQKGRFLPHTLPIIALGDDAFAQAAAEAGALVSGEQLVDDARND